MATLFFSVPYAKIWRIIFHSLFCNIYIQFSLFSKYGLNLVIELTSTADITTIIWILYRPLSCFHSGKHICLYSMQPEWPFKYCYVSSHVTLLFKTLQKITSSFGVKSINFVTVLKITHDVFSSPLPLLFYFMADFLPFLWVTYCCLRAFAHLLQASLSGTFMCCSLYSKVLSEILFLTTLVHKALQNTPTLSSPIPFYMTFSFLTRRKTNTDKNNNKNQQWGFWLFHSPLNLRT